MKAFITVIIIYLMLVLAVRLAHCEPSDFDTNVIHFNDVWNRWYRHHFNCPEDAHYLHDCRPEANKTSYDGFPRVIHEFTSLFGESK